VQALSPSPSTEKKKKKLYASLQYSGSKTEKTTIQYEEFKKAKLQRSRI
jgi:hypothetical protein